MSSKLSTTVNNIHEFLDRAKNTIIQDDFNVLFNMCLVKFDLRPAFYFVDYSGEHPEILKTIKHVYDEFYYTSDEISNAIIHIKPLMPIGKKDWGKWLGQILGYKCALSNKKLMNLNSKTSFTIHYILNLPNKITVEFYAERCGENYDKKYFSDKLKSFNNFAKLIGWRVTMIVSTKFSTHQILELFIDNKLKNKHMQTLFTIMNGSGFGGVLKNIANDHYTFRDLSKNKKLLLFVILQSIYNPFELLYSLSFKNKKSISSLEEKIFNSIEKDPIEMYSELVNSSGVKKFIDDDFIKIQNRLIKNYKKYAKLLKN